MLEIDAEGPTAAVPGRLNISATVVFKKLRMLYFVFKYKMAYVFVITFKY